MPVLSVAIFPKNTNFIAKIRTGLLETDDGNAVNLDTNADAIFPDRVYVKRRNFGRIQTKRMLATSRSRRSWRA